MEIIVMGAVLFICMGYLLKTSYDKKQHAAGEKGDVLGDFLRENNFSPTKRIPFYIGEEPFVFLTDSAKEQFAFVYNGTQKLVHCIPFSAIIDVELLEDSSIIKKSGEEIAAGGLASDAIAGNLRLRIITKQAGGESILISLIESYPPLAKDSRDYRAAFAIAQDIYATIFSALEEGGYLTVLRARQAAQAAWQEREKQGVSTGVAKAKLAAEQDDFATTH